MGSGRPTVRSAAGWVGACLLLAMPGCDSLRETPPPPLVLVEIRATSFALDGERLDRDQLERRLASIADETRRSAKGGTRARVRLVLMPGADARVRDALVERCLELGLDKLETPAVR